jgi:hypothetical protein
MKKKRAQAWGFDLIIGLSIFLTGMLLFFLYSLNFTSNNGGEFESLKREGKIIGDSLMGEGFPEHWDENTVINIGILSNGIVNDTKLLEFHNLAGSDYQRTKQLFAVKNEYYIYFENPVTIGSDTFTGIGLPPSGQNNLVKIVRVAVHDAMIKNINIEVWN